MMCEFESPSITDTTGNVNRVIQVFKLHHELQKRMLSIANRRDEPNRFHISRSKNEVAREREREKKFLFSRSFGRENSALNRNDGSRA